MLRVSFHLGTFTSNEYDYLDAQYILVEQF